MPTVSASADALVHSTLPGHAPATPAQTILVLRTGTAGLSHLAPLHRTRMASALVLAHARQGSASTGARLCELELDRISSDGSVPPGAVAELMGAGAEAYVTDGETRRSAELATISGALAAEADDAGALFRAHALLCVIRALNGEYDSAQRSSDVCRSLEVQHDWPVDSASLPLLLGQVLIASAKFDSPALEAISAVMKETSPLDPRWSSTAAAASAMALLIDGEVNRASSAIVSVINGSEVGILKMTRGFALGVYADLLLARGEAQRVLTLLASTTSPTTHSLCFDMQRAAAHLMMGDDRKALAATDGCVRLGPSHCLRTIPPVLLRRAIAQLRLGRTQAADDTFEEAVHLLSASRSATPLLTLPIAALDELADRLQSRRPDLSPEIAEFRERSHMVPAPRIRAPLPALTQRERDLATELREPKSIAEIARGRHVSPNTIKAQIRSLYAKLGVNRRSDAVDALEQAGFFQ